jgi:ribonuclease HII
MSQPGQQLASIITTDNPASAPHLQCESLLWKQGLHQVAGLDEAGRGALAGPVAAAAVILPCDTDATGVWSQVRDSKVLQPAQRARLDQEIRAAAIAVGVGMVSAPEIDRVGIAAATRLAMAQAIESLASRVDYLLIDWVRLAQCPIPQFSFAKADRISISVAAASILAKVARDAHMVQLARRYPGYGFESHKGYGAPAHLRALAEKGPCAVHRHSFAPIARRASLFTPDGAPAVFHPENRLDGRPAA